MSMPHPTRKRITKQHVAWGTLCAALCCVIGGGLAAGIGGVLFGIGVFFLHFFAVADVERMIANAMRGDLP